MERIVLFDAYGTLFKLDTDTKSLDVLLGEQKPVFLALWREKLLEYSWLISLANEWEPFNQIVEKALKYACRFYGFSFEELRPLMMSIYERPILFPDAKELLDDTSFTACIMSNGEPSTLKDAVALNKIEERIDQIFSACEVEKYKVSPLVYRMATAHYNTGPSHILFVSSNGWDIAGASYFGYETVWVNREEKIFDNLIKGPHHEVKSLNEIKDLI